MFFSNPMIKNEQDSADVKALEDGQEKNGYIYAIRLLAITKRSERELRRKLKEKGYGEGVIEKITSVLKNQKYLNDLSLAKQQVEYSISGNPKGRKRIRFELKHKGLAESVIDTALNDYDTSRELEIAKEIAERKFDQMSEPDSAKKLKRVFDFLSRRGFDYEICRSAMVELKKKT